jgi:hypothetical protein
MYAAYKKSEIFVTDYQSAFEGFHLKRLGYL